MEALLYLHETRHTADLITNMRNELTDAVRSALIRQAYDSDIQLSFGYIHINSKGSVSQISYNGSDITDTDEFIVKQAFHISNENYFDIRKRIKICPDEFCFYPIQIGGQISLTVTKSSPFFEHKYGIAIHNEDVRVEYATKYLIIYRNEKANPDVYLVGSFGPEATANILLENAGRKLGCKSSIYYCFMNSRPELFLHLGVRKSDFVAYHPEKNLDAYNFYVGSIISGIFRINKKTDVNGKVKIKETKKKCLQLVIKMQFGSIKDFCELFDIDQLFMTAYISGADTQIRYKNGNTLSPSRLEELLNLPFTPNADSLKDKCLLIPVDYNDIPA